MTGYPNLTPFADPHDPEGAEVRSQLLTGSRRHIRTEFLACLNQTERSSVCLNIPCIIRTRSHERNHARGCCRKRAPEAFCLQNRDGHRPVCRPCAIALYLLAGPHYGYFRDELYYLACGEHPAWGYVDQPPLIGWIAWLLQHTIGTSLWALRLLPALAGVATIILGGQLARELGGRRWAMFLASLATLMAPVLLALSHLFTMNAFALPLPCRYR
jgi:hypothetical protein